MIELSKKKNHKGGKKVSPAPSIGHTQDHRLVLRQSAAALYSQFSPVFDAVLSSVLKKQYTTNMCN